MARVNCCTHDAVKEPRVRVLRLALSLSLFFAITYSLCILFGILISARGIHELFPMIFPGFVWLTPGGFLAGLVSSFIYGWYAALVFGGLYNAFARQCE